MWCGVYELTRFLHYEHRTQTYLVVTFVNTCKSRKQVSENTALNVEYTLMRHMTDTGTLFSEGLHEPTHTHDNFNPVTHSSQAPSLPLYTPLPISLKLTAKSRDKRIEE